MGQKNRIVCVLKQINKLQIGCLETIKRDRKTAGKSTGSSDNSNTNLCKKKIERKKVKEREKVLTELG